MARKWSAARKAAVRRKRPGTTPKPGETVTIGPEKKGQTPLKFKKGGLHASLGVPQGKKIPEHLIAEAIAGSHGPKAQKQARFYRQVLKKGQRTARKGK